MKRFVIMSLTSTPQAKLLFEKMRHTQARQEVASNNMARSGVAGAKSKDAAHMGGSSNQKEFKIKKSSSQGDPSISGNSISPEEQLIALNEATTDFYRLTEVNKSEKTRIRMISTIGGGK